MARLLFVADVLRAHRALRRRLRLLGDFDRMLFAAGDVLGALRARDRLLVFVDRLRRFFRCLFVGFAPSAMDAATAFLRSWLARLS